MGRYSERLRKIDNKMKIPCDLDTRIWWGKKWKGYTIREAMNEDASYLCWCAEKEIFNPSYPDLQTFQRLKEEQQENRERYE